MTCGDCTFCCRAMGVTELDKPENVWCTFVRRKPSGCSIYDERPKSCREFECYWLATQTSDIPENRMTLPFRPDKSRVMIVESDTQRLIARCDPREPLAFLKQPMWTFLYTCALTRTVYVLAGSRLFKVHPAHERIPGGFTEVSEHMFKVGNEWKVRIPGGRAFA